MRQEKRNYILDIVMKIVFISVCVFLLFYCQHSIKVGDIERNTSSTMGIGAIIACIIFQFIDMINIIKERNVYKKSNKVA